MKIKSKFSNKKFYAKIILVQLIILGILLTTMFGWKNSNYFQLSIAVISIVFIFLIFSYSYYMNSSTFEIEYDENELIIKVNNDVILNVNLCEIEKIEKVQFSFSYSPEFPSPDEYGHVPGKSFILNEKHFLIKLINGKETFIPYDFKYYMTSVRELWLRKNKVYGPTR